MRANLNFWTLSMIIVAFLIGFAFFNVVEVSVFRTLDIFVSEILAKDIATFFGVFGGLFGYKTAFKKQMRKVCRENFLAYRLNLKIALSNMN